MNSRRSAGRSPSPAGRSDGTADGEARATARRARSARGNRNVLATKPAHGGADRRRTRPEELPRRPDPAARRFRCCAHRRTSFIASCSSPSARLGRLVDLQRFHRDRAGRAPLRAQAAADAALLVLDDRARRVAAVQRLAHRVELRRAAQPRDRHQRQAGLRADLDAAAAEDAALRIEDRLHVARQTARRLASAPAPRRSLPRPRGSRCAARRAGSARSGARCGRSGRRAVELRSAGSALRGRGTAPPPSDSWMASAARLPSASASITIRGPNARSPPQYTPGIVVASVRGSTATRPRGVIVISGSAGQAGRVGLLADGEDDRVGLEALLAAPHERRVEAAVVVEDRRDVERLERRRRGRSRR